LKRKHLATLVLLAFSNQLRTFFPISVKKETIKLALPFFQCANMRTYICTYLNFVPQRLEWEMPPFLTIQFLWSEESNNVSAHLLLDSPGAQINSSMKNLKEGQSPAGGGLEANSESMTDG
jgi:hypothetical protein